MHGEAMLPQPKPTGREHDVPYMLFVKTLPCAALSVEGHKCDGSPIQADHAGRRSLGRKCSDRETVPHCVRAHVQRESFSGPFREWPRERMREYLDAAIAATQAAYERRAA